MCPKEQKSTQFSEQYSFLNHQVFWPQFQYFRPFPGLNSDNSTWVSAPKPSSFLSRWKVPPCLSHLYFPYLASSSPTSNPVAPFPHYHHYLEPCHAPFGFPDKKSFPLIPAWIKSSSSQLLRLLLCLSVIRLTGSLTSSPPPPSPD